MTPEQIEALIIKTGIKWEKIAKNIWDIDDPDDDIPGITFTIEPSEKYGEELLKFTVFVCDVPADAKPEFFKEFLRLNFKIEHGAFAMESKSEMAFFDTLELKNLDEDEFEATLRAMMAAPRIFQKRFDIEFYTLGKPQF